MNKKVYLNAPRAAQTLGLITLALFSHTGFAQIEDMGVSINLIHDNNAPPFKIYDGHYITFNGFFAVDPLDFYQYDKQKRPDKFEILAEDDPDQVKFKLEMDFLGVDGQEYKEPLEAVVSDGVVERQLISAGRYKAFEWGYSQKATKPDRTIKTYTDVNSASVYYPVVRKIPFFMTTEMLDIPWAGPGSGGAARRFFNPALWEFNIGFEVTRHAMNLPGTIAPQKDSIGCPVYYEFMFMGYVSGFPEGISTKDDLRRLPDGITVVTGIKECGDELATGGVIAGCAGNTKIALSESSLYDLFNSNDRSFGAYALHEIMHAWGERSHSSESNNFMNDTLPSEYPLVTKEQCMQLVKKKPASTGKFYERNAGVWGGLK